MVGHASVLAAGGKLAHKHARCGFFASTGEEAAQLEATLGIPVVRHRHKKPAGSAEELERHFGCPPSQLVMVGDRYMTDVLYGRRLGMLTIRTAPLTNSGRLPIEPGVGACSALARGIPEQRGAPPATAIRTRPDPCAGEPAGVRLARRAEERLVQGADRRGMCAGGVDRSWSGCGSVRADKRRSAALSATARLRLLPQGSGQHTRLFRMERMPTDSSRTQASGSSGQSARTPPRRERTIAVADRSADHNAAGAWSCRCASRDRQPGSQFKTTRLTYVAGEPRPTLTERSSFYNSDRA